VVAPRIDRMLLAGVMLAGAVALASCTSPRSHRARSKPETASPVAVARLQLPYRACGKPQKVGGSIYTVVSRGADRGDSLVRYDMRTGSISTVIKAPDPELIGWFVVNEKWLVWSVGNELFARSIRTGRQYRIADSRDLYAPALGGDLVAFDDLSRKRSHRMVVHDLARQESTVVAPIAVADLYNNFPAWDGTRLLWTDVAEGDGVYRVYDAASGRVEDHRLSAVRFRYPGYAKIADGRFYSINFDDVEQWNWGTQRLGYYACAEKRFVPLEPEGFVANSLDVAGGLVAVVDSDQRLTVRLAEAPEGRVYRPVPGRVDFVESSPDGTLIAWREGVGDANHSELFLIRRR